MNGGGVKGLFGESRGFRGWVEIKEEIATQDSKSESHAECGEWIVVVQDWKGRSDGQSASSRISRSHYEALATWSPFSLRWWPLLCLQKSICQRVFLESSTEDIWAVFFAPFGPSCQLRNVSF